MKKHLNSIILILPILISGCVTPIGISEHNFDSKDTSWKENGNGIVVGSIVRDTDERWDQYRIEIRSLDKKVDSTIALGTSLGWKNEKDIGGPGSIFAKTLPAGNYEIYKHQRYIGTEWMHTEGDYSVVFEVKEGKITYLGRFQLHHKKMKTDLFGWERPLLFDWEVYDNFEEDKIYIKSEIPEVVLSDVVIDIIENKPNSELRSPSVRDMINVDPVSEADPQKSIKMSDISCKKPYVFTQDCSNWSGAKRKIIIDGIELKIAGSEGGRYILLMDAHPLKNAINQPLHQGSKIANRNFYVVEKVLLENEIEFLDVIPIKSFGSISGYVLELTEDGYSILKNYTTK